jgi:hypothetical protein
MATRRRVAPEWVRITEGERVLRRRGWRVSVRTIRRWAHDGSVETNHPPGCRNWYLVRLASLVAAAQRWCRIHGR